MKKKLLITLLSAAAVHATSESMTQSYFKRFTQAYLKVIVYLTEKRHGAPHTAPLVDAALAHVDDSVKAVDMLGSQFPEFIKLAEPGATSAEAASNAQATAHVDAYFRTKLNRDDVSSIEALRTLVAIKCLLWVKNNNHLQFTSGQKNENTRLTPELFAWMRELAQEAIPTTADENAQIYALLINDLGKVLAKNGEDHDAALAKVFTLSSTERAQILPTFEKLTPYEQAEAKRLLTSGVNIAQMGQLESVACEAQELKKLSLKDRVKLLTHIMFDVAGAMGHNGTTYSITFANPAAKTYKNIYESLTARDIYAEFMKKQALRFELITKDTQALSPELIAQTRLATMVRSDNKTMAYDNAIKHFNALPEDVRAALIKELQETGYTSKALKLEYGPALLNNAVLNKADGLVGVKDALVLVADIYAAARKYVANEEAGVVTVHVSKISQAVKGMQASDLNGKKIEIVKLNDHELEARFA